MQGVKYRTLIKKQERIGEEIKYGKRKNDGKSNTNKVVAKIHRQ